MILYESLWEDIEYETAQEADTIWSESSKRDRTQRKPVGLNAKRKKQRKSARVARRNNRR